MMAARSQGLQWLVFVVVGSLSAWHLLSGARVEVDDAFIVLRTAENLAAGHGLVFTPGDAFMPVTCPLWTMLLGGVRALSPDGDLVELARRISIGFTCTASVLLFALLRPLLGWFAVAMGPLLMLAKEVPEHAGNEVGMACCFAAATILAAQHRRHTIAAAAAGLLYLTRGEGVLLAGLVFAPGVWSAFRRGELAAHLRTLLVPAAVFGSIAAAWHIYHLLQFGSLMPKTLGVKVLQGTSGMWPRFGQRLLANFWGYLKWGPIFAPLFVVGLVYLLRRAWLLPAWAMLHLAFYSALRVPNYDWYYYPLFVVVPIGILAGIVALATRTAGRFGPAVATWGGALATVATVVAWVPTTIPTANGERVDQYRAVANWLETNAATTPRPLVLAFEIGIIGYFARAFPFVDPPGILVPDLTRPLLMDWHELVRRREPGLLVFREDLGPEVRVGDTVRKLEFVYDRAITLPAHGYPQHIYRRRT